MAAMPIERVLACSDLTEESRGVVPRAMMLAEAFGADLTVAHVIEADGSAAETDRRISREHLERQLADLWTGGLEPEIAILDGFAGPALYHLAEDRGAGLVVLGFHHDRGLEGPDLGSTMTTILVKTKKDVLLVRRDSRKPYRSVLVSWDGSKALRPAINRARAYAPDAEFIVFSNVTLAAGKDEAEKMLQEALGDDRRERMLVRSGSITANLRDVVEGEGIDLLVLPTRGSQGGDLGYIASEILAERLCDTLCLRQNAAV